MADLVIDYGLLHQLAVNVRELKSNLDIKLPPRTATGGDAGGGGSRGSGGGRNQLFARSQVLSTAGPGAVQASSADIGNPALHAKLAAFFTAWNGPFHDAMDRLDDLAEVFDAVATKFFDMDADFAVKANTLLASLKQSAWQSAKAEYDHYQSLKDKRLSYQYYDKDGHLVTGSRPLLDPDQPPPPPPGEMPTSTVTDTTVTNTQYDGQNRVISESSTVTSPSGLSYKETTTYTYGPTADGTDGVVSFTTTVTHSDGSLETITHTNNSDGTATVTDDTPEGRSTSTVTPKANDDGYTARTVGPDGKTTNIDVTDNPSGTPDRKVVDGPDGRRTYTGDADSDSWTQESGPPTTGNGTHNPPADSGEGAPHNSGGGHGPRVV